MSISPGELFEFPHPRTGVVEMWEAVNIAGPRVELKAITGDYHSDLDRTVSGRVEDIIKYKSPISGPSK